MSGDGRGSCSIGTLIAAGLLSMELGAGSAQAAPCVLAASHAGLTFPVERVSQEWICRLQPIVEGYTTANKVGPTKTLLSESLYRYLLDRPQVAAALINRLDLAPYKAETRSPGFYWGDDGEGTEGTLQLIYQDGRNRMYYLEGTHHSRLLPNVSGRAVVFLHMEAVKGRGEGDAIESTIVSYTRLDNRVLAGMASLLRPLVGSVVTRKLVKGLDVVNRLGKEMREHPERVLFEAQDPPSLPAEDVAFLTQALVPGATGPKARTTP